MKKSLLFCMAVLFLIRSDLYAANGDLIVNGKLGIGTSIPGWPLTVSGSAAQISNATMPQLKLIIPGVTEWELVNNGNFEFRQDNGAPKLFIQSSTGNIGIGTTGPAASLHAFGYNSVSPQLTIESRDEDLYLAYRDTFNLYSWWNGLRRKYMSITGLGWIRQYDSNGTIIMQLAGNVAQKTVGGSWTDFSDARAKKNITQMTGALDKLMQLRGVNFEWINPASHGDLRSVQGGFLAQDVEKVFPNWVTEMDAQGRDIDLSSDGKLKALTLPFEFDALVVAAIQEQQRQIEELRQENAAIKAYLCGKDPKAMFCGK